MNRERGFVETWILVFLLFGIGCTAMFVVGMSMGRKNAIDGLSPEIQRNRTIIASIRMDLDSLSRQLITARTLLVERGVASYYGKWHHGKTTASGVPFDMNALTAASRKWPLGTMVKVTSLKNGKSVVVYINDRGPYVGCRVIDLSFAAAKQLGMIRAGTHPVKIEPVLE